MAGTATTLLSLLMVAGLALVSGGVYTLWKRRGAVRGALMIAAGLVMWGNVAIATL